MTKEKRLLALQRQIRRLQQRIKDLERQSRRYSWVRLIVFSAGVLISASVFFLGYPQFLWVPLLIALVVFLFVIRLHRKIDRSITRHRLWSEIKARQIARMLLDWQRLPSTMLEPETSIELDLDLTGNYSLHRLIDTAVSSGGGNRLREWLANPDPDPQETTGRQQITRELTPLSLFRDKLILKGALAAQDNEGWRPEDLLAWLKSHTLPSSVRPWLLLLSALAILNISLFLLYLVSPLPPLWIATFLLYAVLFLARSGELGEPFGESTHLRDALEQLLAVFQHLESHHYRETPHLQALCAPFLDPTQRPSAHLKRFNRIVNATGIRGNPFFWLALNILVPWDYYFAYRLDQYKDEMARHLPRWMQIWFDLEALSSLANLAYLNPHYTFPDLLQDDSEVSPVFRANELGHPLISDDVKVCNDFTIKNLGTIDIFTGSNMSGKSTFLRTIGINLALAFAGGPVDARQLLTIPFRLFTCIRITDSVTDGISYFYAEVKCLKALLEALEQEDSLPVFYFIDEIFRGTNNRERLIGSQAYVQSLAGRPGVGLIATHDLELVHLADEISGIRNYHFTDEVTDGRMLFDYQLISGPSPTTNALKIMRIEGLPV